MKPCCSNATQKPNRGFWSPCGGKVKMDIGESPYVCGCREAREEMGLEIQPSDLHLAGLISEYGYQGQTHWLMFLFEVKVKLKSLPPPMAEGRFEFFPREKIANLNIPQTDREKIWPWFWQFRGGFFARTAIAIRTDATTGRWRKSKANPLRKSANLEI
jgi:8-oxo-dGTP diphosphatase